MYAETRMKIMLPAIRTRRRLAHFVVVVALLLAPVLIALATPAHAGHSTVQAELAGVSASPQVAEPGPMAPLCHSGVLCVFVGSFMPNNNLPAPIAAWAGMPPEAWTWSSWIGAPGAHPPKSA